MIHSIQTEGLSIILNDRIQQRGLVEELKGKIDDIERFTEVLEKYADKITRDLTP